MLRRSPRLTPASLAARRANALKSTGPRTARGKAWSSLNALRHGWNARNLRAKIERTGDQEALVLFDWIFTRFFELCDISTERDWSYHLRLAARVWCHVTGRILLPRVRKSPRKGWDILDRLYRYSERQVCPRSFTLLDYRDVGLRFTNPIPSRRRRVNLAWLPEVEFLSPPPRLPRARRVRKRKGELAKWAPGSAATASPGERPHGVAERRAGGTAGFPGKPGGWRLRRCGRIEAGMCRRTSELSHRIWGPGLGSWCAVPQKPLQQPPPAPP